MKLDSVMTATDLRGKSVNELTETLNELRKEQFSLRLQAATGQAMKPHTFQVARRNIARVKTILNEKKRSGNDS